MDLGLVRYDAMCKAIAECSKIDEAKEIRDKARAIEVYAAQALNLEAEEKAAQIRLRAEHRAGELLELAKAHGQRQASNRPMQKPSRPATLKELGISRDQCAKWQKLAAIPKAEFEAEITRPHQKPSTEGLIAKYYPAKLQPIHMEPSALNAWGRLKDFEREIMLRPLGELFPLMTEAMQDDVLRIVPTLTAWLDDFQARKRRAS